MGYRWSKAAVTASLFSACLFAPLAAEPQALNTDPTAAQNAQKLTDQLRSSGKIQGDQSVIGVKDGQALTAPASMMGGS